MIVVIIVVILIAVAMLCAGVAGIVQVVKQKPAGKTDISAREVAEILAQRGAASYQQRRLRKCRKKASYTDAEVAMICYSERKK